MREASGWLLDLLLAGMETAVERSARSLSEAISGSTIRALDHQSPRNINSAKQTPANLISRLNVLPSRLPALLAEAPSDAVIEAHPATGLCRMSFTGATAEAISEARALAARFGGTCTIERCPPDLKRSIDVFGDAPPSLSLMRAVKAEFDPNRVLSPGRFVGKI
jgi:glycolate oxidase FAD binding subunit